MIKFALIVFLSSICFPAFAQITSEPVTDQNGDYLGDVWTDSYNWKKCDANSEDEDCADAVSPVVCMTYSNDCIAPIVCDLEVSALLAEPFTGFTKIVTDVREEVVFYNQTHEVCFNFAKDAYNAWFLVDTSNPKISCSRLVEEDKI